MIIRLGSRVVRRALSFPGRSLLGTITHVATREPAAALTFDDGPHPDFTLRLLDLLEKYQARGTFFMLGEAASRYPELVKRIGESGHTIGNHSWDHPSFPSVSSDERRRQMRACERATAPYGRRLFRPPHGEQNVASRLDALWLGYQVVAWNCDVGDWYDTDAPRMARALLRQLQPGNIICLHDALRWHPSPQRVPRLERRPNVERGSMLAAVEMLLRATSGAFRFVTVPELFRYGRVQRRNWYRTTPPDTRENNRRRSAA